MMMYCKSIVTRRRALETYIVLFFICIQRYLMLCTLDAFLISSAGSIIHHYHGLSNEISREIYSLQCKGTRDQLFTLSDVNYDEIYQWNSGLCIDKDSVLQGLVSHAPESFYIIDRSISRISDYIRDLDIRDVTMIKSDEKAVDLLNDIQSLCSYLVKSAYAIQFKFITRSRHQDIISIIWSVTMITDKNGKSGWNNIQMIEEVDDIPTIIELSDWCDIIKNREHLYHRKNCLEICHEALLKSIESSSQTSFTYKQEIEDILTQLEKRISLTLGSDLRGRTSADAAFNLAMAGVENRRALFDSLVLITIRELERVGTRSSFKPKYVIQIVEKLAVTGASVAILQTLYKTAAYILDAKNYDDIDLVKSLAQGEFGLESDRPLLWLWRFSKRQRKLGPKDFILNRQNKSIVWDDIFTNAYNKLIIDIGSGMGASLLNASVLSRRIKYQSNEKTKDVLWENCNYAGTELNEMMVRYANGVASRLDTVNEDKFVHFFSLPAEEFLNQILISYEGKVSLILIQFPSPYRLIRDENTIGNTQLPTSANDGFMVTESLLQTIIKVLSLNKGNGKLLIQTKCEDVAIHIKNLALSTGSLQLIPCSDYVKNIDRDIYFKNDKMRPKRVEQWLSSQTVTERTEGLFWSRSRIMPSFARSETEIACEDDGSFIHRCLMQYYEPI